MKKTLSLIPVLGAAFVSQNALAAPHAHGHGESHLEDGITISGFSDFQVGLRDQDLDTGKYSRGAAFRNDNEVHINFQGTADNGLKYGAVIELEADVTAADRDAGTNADKTYIFLQTGAGRIELGANSDAGHMLGVSEASFAAAAGGTHGDYDLFIHIPDGPGDHHIPVIHSPSLPLAHAHGVSEDANKITIITPRMSGVQAGASYILDSGEVGTATGFSSESDHEQFENVINLAINVQQDFDDVSVTASAIGEFGEAEDADEEDLAAYVLGLNVGVGHFMFGGSYGDWGDSTLAVGSTSDDGGFWSLGAAVAHGATNASIGYLDSEVDNNELTNLSIGVDHSLAPGLTPYIEANFFDIDAGSASVSDNEGTVVIVGTTVNF